MRAGWPLQQSPCPTVLCCRHSHPRAFKLGRRAARRDNVERFLMGRQMFVVFIVFFAAKLTTIHSESDTDFLFPCPAWFRESHQTTLMARKNILQIFLW